MAKKGQNAVPVWAAVQERIGVPGGGARTFLLFLALAAPAELG